MNLSNILVPFISTMVGCVVAWLTSRHFYKKSGNELKEESQELRKLINALIILEQDDKGQIKPMTDSEGKLITIKGFLRGSSQVKTTITGKRTNMATTGESEIF